MANEKEQQAIDMAKDPERLLPGEERDIANPDLGDVTHWISVYTELSTTKRTLIGHLKKLMKSQSQPAQDELERADLRLLETQVERFEPRLTYWQSKLAALDGHGPKGFEPAKRRQGTDRG